MNVRMTRSRVRQESSQRGISGIWRRSVALACVASMIGPYVMAQRPIADGGVPADEQRVLESLLARHVNVALTQVTRRQAVDALSRSAKVLVEYQIPTLEAYPSRITLQAGELTLGVALERVFAGTSLRVEAEGSDHLLIVDSTTTPRADSTHVGTVAGIVIDSATGRPLSDVNVQFQGAKRRVVTGQDGRFVMTNVPVGRQAFVARRFGYRPATIMETVTIDERTSVRFMAVAVPNVLTGVVTTATGVQERRQLGTDITVINADSVMRIAPVSSVTDLLENRVPGLTVTRSSGLPGAPSRLRLRGIGGGLVTGGANTSNDPIVIVDGIRIYARASSGRDTALAISRPASSGVSAGGDVQYAPPSAIDQIDPNAIDKIEVFKGPSATAQWGADAANGVIVITTKRGQAGRTHIDGAVQYGVDYMPGTFRAPGFYPFASPRYGGASRLCLTLNGLYLDLGGVTPIGCDVPDSLVRFQALDDPTFSPFGDGRRVGGSVSVNGGSGTITYGLTASASSQLGYLQLPSYFRNSYDEAYGSEAPAWMRRPNKDTYWSGTSNVTIDPRAGVRVTLTGKITNTANRHAAGEALLARLGSTYIDTANLDPKVAVAGVLQRFTSNVVTTDMAVTGDVTRWNAFPVSATIGLSRNERDEHSMIPGGQLADPGDIATNDLLAATSDTLGAYGVGHGNVNTQTGNVFGTLFPKGLVSTTVGIDVVRTAFDDFQARSDTLPRGLTAPLAYTRASGRSSASNTAGWFVAPQLNLNSRLFVSPGLRFDGGSASSSAGHNTSLLSLPRINLSWVAIDRTGLTPIGGVLTLLRPRVAFGIAGVQPDPSWNLRLFTSDTGGAYLGFIGNTRLRPERSREIEGGFDADLWGARLSLTATGYYKLRIDAIQSLQYPASVNGGGLYYTNIGRVRNTGTELTVNANPIATPLFNLNVSASFSADRNVLTKLAGGALSINRSGTGARLVQGYPIDGRWERPIVGYADANGDGYLSFSEVATGDSSIYIGSAIPKYELPFNAGVSLWHGLVGVNAGFEYKNGITQYNLANQQLLTNLYFNPASSLGEQAAALEAFCAPSTPTEASSFCTTANGDHVGTAIGLTQAVNVLRFSTFSVNYNVPPAFSRRFGIPGMTVGVQGANLGLWSNYRGKDPDVNADLVGETLSDVGQAPLPRSWTLRVSVRN